MWSPVHPRSTPTRLPLAARTATAVASVISVSLSADVARLGSGLRNPAGSSHRGTEPEGRHRQDDDSDQSGRRLAERGYETLLIDTDAQGNVGASLGIKGERSLYHVLVDGVDASEVAVPVRSHLDVITADATLAVAGSGWPGGTRS